MKHIEIEGYVYCEFEGSVHDDVPDPWGYGPVWEIHLPTDHENWTLEARPPQYPAPAWHYTCPGPHHPLFWKG